MTSKSKPTKKIKPYLLAYEDYKTGDYTYEQIAKKYKVTISAVRSWQNRFWRDMQNAADDSQNPQTGADNLRGDSQAGQQQEPQKPLVQVLPTNGQTDKKCFAALVAKNAEDTKPAALMAGYSRDNLPKLEPRQLRFVEEYLLDLSTQDAAVRAGYSISRAAATGCDLLARDDVQAHIQSALAERRKRTGSNIDRATQELNCIANANLIDIVDKQGNIRDDVTREAMAAVKSIKTRKIPQKNGPPIIETQVEIFDKVKADELQARINGWLVDRKQSQINISYEDSESRQARIRELAAKALEDANTFDADATVLPDDDRA